MICARSSPKTFLPTQSTRGLGLTCLKLFSLLTKSIYNLLKNTDGLFRMVVLSQWFIPYVYFIGHYSVNLIGHFLKFIGFVVARDGVHLPNKFQENWHNSHLLSFSNKDTKKEAQLNSTEKKSVVQSVVGVTSRCQIPRCRHKNSCQSRRRSVQVWDQSNS